MLRCSEALKFVQEETLKVFCAAYLNERTSAALRNAYTTLLLRAAQYYLTNQDRPKENLYITSIYKTGAHYVSAFRASFMKACGRSQFLFASSRLYGFSKFEICMSKY